MMEEAFRAPPVLPEATTTTSPPPPQIASLAMADEFAAFLEVFSRGRGVKGVCGVDGIVADPSLFCPFSDPICFFNHSFSRVFLGFWGLSGVLLGCF
jgi:hypothetical protein